MANKHTERYSTSYVMRKMQIKTIMKYHYTPIRMAQNTENTKCWRGYRTTELSFPASGKAKQFRYFGIQFVSFLQKVDIFLLYDSTITLLGIYPKDLKACPQKMCTQMFAAALFIIAKMWKQSRCPLVGEQIKTLCQVHSDNGILLNTHTHTHTHKEMSYQTMRRHGDNLNACY